MDAPKLTVQVKSILLDGTDDHLLYLDIYEYGGIVIHELFGKRGIPETLEEVQNLDNNVYHVTMALKEKYAKKLIEALKDEKLMLFPEDKVNGQ